MMIWDGSAVVTAANTMSEAVKKAQAGQTSLKTVLIGAVVVGAVLIILFRKRG